jgi:ABC-type bacteriocin/lantibiotic exporter with double-glycine peptidase domain
VKPSKPPFIPQERHNTCCLACLRMALAHHALDAPGEEGLIAEASMEAEGIDFTEMRRLARLHGLRAEIEFPRTPRPSPLTSRRERR